MQTIRIKQVDAFTRTSFFGNPAGVVTDANGLSSKLMQKIASEMNASETVYVLESEHEDCDLRLRWFTPTQEVDLCGHATIAAFHALAEEGAYGLEMGEPQSFIVETRSGNLVVDVEWNDIVPYIKFSLPIPRFFPYPGDISLLCGALGLTDIELSSKIKPQITSNGYCYVPLKNYDSLATAEPNQALLAQMKEQYDLSGFAVVTTDTADTDVDWHMRFFAPELGVLEDPVTGSANGPMGAFLWEFDLIPKDKAVYKFVAEQGRSVGRSGLVSVILRINGKEIEELQVCGEAVTVLEGNIYPNQNKPEQL